MQVPFILIIFSALINSLEEDACVCVCVCVCAHSNWDITRETIGDPANEEVSVAREASQSTESHFPGRGTSLCSPVFSLVGLKFNFARIAR